MACVFRRVAARPRVVAAAASRSNFEWAASLRLSHCAATLAPSSASSVTPLAARSGTLRRGAGHMLAARAVGKAGAARSAGLAEAACNEPLGTVEHKPCPCRPRGAAFHGHRASVGQMPTADRATAGPISTDSPLRCAKRACRDNDASRGSSMGRSLWRGRDRAVVSVAERGVPADAHELRHRSCAQACSKARKGGRCRI